ncbi:diuretic hormone class 2 [Copidosoma floridanum]|uniref:diuretic hormone class 2 n=1 Tax=Copidosoma floridanum TaxID=29053 RepID=UPI0006C9AEDA|nr:diuretic hormone class 2 [Copidosoma floridanum]
MQKKIALPRLLLAAVVLAAFAASYPTQALPYRLAYDERRAAWNPYQMDYPDATQELLERLESMGLIRAPEDQKRSLDLGLNRGYSGSQAAKHLMGLAAANYAGGPGRRRRSESAA